MARTYRNLRGQGLFRIPVLIDDIASYSDYFEVSQLDDRIFHAGKNGFLLRGTGVLKPNSEISIEILDRLNNSVFVSPVAGYEEGASRLISVEIYQKTADGTAKLIILGTAQTYADGSPIPTEWQNRPNVRWVIPIQIETANLNISPLRLANEPTAIITEKDYLTTFISKSLVTNDLYTASLDYDYASNKSDGYAITMLNNAGQPVTFFDTVNVDGIFTGSLLRKTIESSSAGVITTVSTGDNQGYVTASVSMSLDKVLNETTAITQTPIKFGDDTDYLNPLLTSGSFQRVAQIADLGGGATKHTIEEYTSSVVFEYVSESVVNLTSTSSVMSFRIPFVQTITGEIAKVKISAKESNAAITSFVPFAEFVPGERNLITSSSLSGAQIGSFHQAGVFTERHILDSNWFSALFNKADGDFNQTDYESDGTSLTYGKTSITSSEKILEGAEVDHTASVVPYFFGTKTGIQLYKNVEYTLKYTAVYTPTYVTRSAGIAQSGPGTNAEGYEYTTSNIGLLKTFLTRTANHIDSGSFLVNDAEPVQIGAVSKYGMWVDSIKTRDRDKSLHEREVNFKVPGNGLTYLRFKSEDGFWSFGNIEITPAVERGFNPDEIIFDAENNTLPATTNDFKIQFLNFEDNPIDYHLIGSSVFVSASNLAVDGQTGASVNIVFARADTVPNIPTNSPGIPSANIQWYDSTPVGSTGSADVTKLLWASRGLKAVGATNFVWTTPFQVAGAAHAEVYVYRYNNSGAPSGGTYNFVTNTLTVPTNWVKDPPALTADGDKVYVAVGLANGASTATAASVAWGTPVVYAQRTDGVTGSSATSVNLKASKYVIPYTAAGTHASGQTITLTADSINFDNAYFKFTGGGSAFSDEGSYIDGSGQNQDTATFSIPTAYSSTPYTFEVGVAEGDQSEIASDSITIASVQPGVDGKDAYTVVLTNEFHSVPVSKTGVITYDDTGTDIIAYRGITRLLGKTTAGDPGTGYFKVTAVSDTNWDNNSEVGDIIAQNSPTATSRLEVPDHDDITALTAAVSYTINLEGLVSVVKLQSFSKSTDGSDAKNLVIAASSQVVVFDDDQDTTPTPATITITATQTNQASDLIDGVLSTVTNGTKEFVSYSGANGTGFATWTVTPTGTYPITCTVTNNSLTDTIKIHKITGGADAYTVIMTNEAHIIPVDKAGTITYTGSGTDFIAYRGVNRLTGINTVHDQFNVTGATYSNTTTITHTANGNIAVGQRVTGTGIPSGANVAEILTPTTFRLSMTTTGGSQSGTLELDRLPEAGEFQVQYVEDTSWTTPDELAVLDDTYNLRIGNHDGMTASRASITYAVNLENLQTIIKQQSHAKSTDGADGTAAKSLIISSDSQILAYSDANDDSPDPTSFTISAKQANGSADFVTGDLSVSGGSIVADSFSYPSHAAVGTGTATWEVEPANSGNPSAASIVCTVTVSADSLSDSTTVHRIVGGTDAYTVILSNEAHVLPTTAAGSVTYAGSGTTFTAYKGTTRLTGDTATSCGVGEFCITTFANENWDNPDTDPIKVGDDLVIGNHEDISTGETRATCTYTISLEGLATVTKVQSFSKSTDGSDGTSAKGLVVTADSQAYHFTDSNSTTAADDLIRVNIKQQNLSGTVGTTDVDIDPTGADNSFDPAALIGSVTSGTGQQYFDLKFSAGTPNSLGGLKAALPVVISVTKDSITDTTTIYKSEGGTTAKTIVLSAEGNTFVEDINGDVTPGYIKFTVNKQNTSAAVVWTVSPFVTFYDDETDGNATTSANPMYLRKADYGANTNVLITATCDGITDTARVIRLVAESGNVQALLDNGVHNYVAHSTGYISNYAGGGTNIHVYEGATLLDYAGIGTGTTAEILASISAGEWKVVVSDLGTITEGVPTSAGSSGAHYATVPAHSAISNSNDACQVTYTITGKTSNGTAFSLAPKQTLTKTKDGVGAILAYLSNETHTFTGDLTGAVTAFTNSGTTVTVKEGSTVVIYDADWSAGGGLAKASTYKVIAAATNCTLEGSVAAGQTHGKPDSVSSNIATYLPVDAVVTDSSPKIDFTVNVTDSEGTDHTIITTQTFSIAKTGATGDTTYTWTKYATNSDGTEGFNDTYSAGKTYIGMAFNQTTATESNTPGDYTWSRLEGEAGTTYYTWIKYASNAAGSADFSDTYTAGTTTYVGYVYGQEEATESTNPALYTWSRLEGVNADNKFTWVKYASNAAGSANFSDTYTAGTTTYIGMAFNQTTATESNTPGEYIWTKIEGEDGVTTYTWVKYASNAAGSANFSDTYTAGTTTYIGMAFNKTSSVESTDPTVYTWTKIEGTEGASVNIVFKRADTKPDTPADSSGVPTSEGWSDDVPTGDAAGTELLWASRGLKALGDPKFEWSTVFQLEGAVHAEIYVYRYNNSGAPSGGTYNFVTNELTLPANWVKNPPSLTGNTDKVYVSVGIVNGAATATAATITWGAVAVYAQRTDGTPGGTGAAGLRTIQGYLYYEKTSNVSVAPSVPTYANGGSITYTFATGDIDGRTASSATEVLALADTSAVDKWTNQPRPNVATSANTFWTVRYFGTEALAAADDIAVTYSSVVKQTSFSGVVTFTDGTFSKDGSSVYNTTTIDGGHITTGYISSANLDGTSDGSAFTTEGTRITLSNGAIAAENFRIDEDGDAYFKGDLTAESGRLGGANGYYIGSNDLYAGNSDIANAATTIVLGDLDRAISSNFGGPKIALGATANTMTPSGSAAQVGTITGTGFYADGAGNFRVGSTTNYLAFNADNNTITLNGTLKGTSTAAILDIDISEYTLTNMATEIIEIKDSDDGITSRILGGPEGGEGGGTGISRSAVAFLTSNPDTDQRFGQVSVGVAASSTTAGNILTVHGNILCNKIDQTNPGNQVPSDTFKATKNHGEAIGMRTPHFLIMPAAGSIPVGSIWSDINGGGSAPTLGSLKLGVYGGTGATTVGTIAILELLAPVDGAPHDENNTALFVITGNTVTTGVWGGSSIPTTKTAAKVTSIVAGSRISISGGTGAVTVTATSQTDNNFTNADHSKLDGIEAGAEVTNATKVTSAGALMLTVSSTQTVAGNVQAPDFIATSDIRLKNVIGGVSNALSTVNKLNAIRYTWKDERNDKEHIGFSAQEVLELVPEAVYGSEETEYGISYGKLVPVLVEAIKELTAEVEALKKKLGD